MVKIKDTIYNRLAIHKRIEETRPERIKKTDLYNFFDGSVHALDLKDIQQMEKVVEKDYRAMKLFLERARKQHL